MNPMPWYDTHGLRFIHPEGWQVEREIDGDDWQVTVQSPESAFILIKPLGPIEDLDEAAEVTLETMREDYKDLEEEAAEEIIGGVPCRGYDVNFTCLDLITTCQIRYLRAGDEAVLIMSQAADIDPPEYQMEMERLRRSISIQS
jgi:hypothetical protein